MSSSKRRAEAIDLDYNLEHDLSPFSPSFTALPASAKVPRREADEDKAGSATSSRHHIARGSAAGHNRGSTAAMSLSPAASVPAVKQEDDSEIEALSPVKPRRDKGKGKMRYLPELPEEVWRRIWSIYYQDCATRWHGQMSYTGALLPLLISPEHTQIAMPVLYAYPLLSYDTITPFLSSISRPSSFYPNLLPPLVRNLCVQATPERIDHGQSDGYRRTNFLHACLGDVLQLVPHLAGFTLKDTLILNSTDGRALFAALKHIRPRKVRLELRMWDLHDSPFGQDLIAATQQSVHCHSLIGMHQQIPSVDRSSGHFSSRARTDGGTHYIQEAWRNALWRGHELEMPAWWIASARPANQDQNQHDVIDLTGGETAAANDDDDDAEDDRGADHATSLALSDLNLDTVVPGAPGTSAPRPHGVIDASRMSYPPRTTDRYLHARPARSAFARTLDDGAMITRHGARRTLAAPVAADVTDGASSAVTDSISASRDGTSAVAGGGEENESQADEASPNPAASMAATHRSPGLSGPEDVERSLGSDNDSDDDDPAPMGGGEPIRVRSTHTRAPTSTLAHASGPSRLSATGSALPDDMQRLSDVTYSATAPRSEQLRTPLTIRYDQTHADHLPTNHAAHTERLDRISDRDRLVGDLEGQFGKRAEAEDNEAERRQYLNRHGNSSLPDQSGPPRRPSHLMGGLRSSIPDDAYIPVPQRQSAILARARRSAQGRSETAQPSGSSSSGARPIGDALDQSDSSNQQRMARDDGNDNAFLNEGDMSGTASTLRETAPVLHDMQGPSGNAGSSDQSAGVERRQYGRRGLGLAESILPATSPAHRLLRMIRDSRTHGNTGHVGPQAIGNGLTISSQASYSRWTRRIRQYGNDHDQIPVATRLGLSATNALRTAHAASDRGNAAQTAISQPAHRTPTNPHLWEVELIERTAASHALARALRDALARLLQDWCPTLEALSFVALDPLASLVVRSPDLDFWINVPVPHIRVRLPRAINSLAVFKGAKECARDRARAREANGVGGVDGTAFGIGAMGHAQGADALSDATTDGDEGEEVDIDIILPGEAMGSASTQAETSTAALQNVHNVVANGLHHGSSSGNNAAAGPRLTRLTLEDAEEASRVVGGDGHGGGLVHPDVRIFEIEVNTTRELGDEIWEKAGWQLPSVLCRMLVGQDWDDVLIGSSSSNPIDDSPYSDPGQPPESAHSDGDSFQFDSDWDEGVSGEEQDEAMGAFREEQEREVDSTFDAAAARAQADRIAQRRKEREEGPGKHV